MIEPELLLQETSKIIEHYDHQAMLTGERFNLFSVLGLESKENRTHSAMLANLLNPRGSHYQGSVFLELFLKEIKLDQWIDVRTASVTPEFSIGKLEIDGDNATGGRIDVFIKDQGGNSVCIENKIYAGDQYKQILRYYNYHTTSNKVFYLTLLPAQPAANSKMHLEAETHFFCITYREHILNWLNQCLQTVENVPILKVSLQQYISLLNKLTSIQMTETKELNKLMLHYPYAAEAIAENYAKCKADIGDSLRRSLVSNLKTKLQGKYNIYEGDPASYEYSQIWIKFADYDNANFFFGIESFSYLLNDCLEIGVFRWDGTTEINLGMEKKDNKFWPYFEQFPPFDGIEVNFNNPTLLENIYLDSDFEGRFIKHLVDVTLVFIEKYEEKLETYLETVYPKSLKESSTNTPTNNG